MAAIVDVAGWFLINVSNLNHKKLQLLTYYAYAWFIALNNESADKITERLCDARFEAWVHGAVEPKLHDKYRDYGSKTIPTPDLCVAIFSPAELETLRQVKDTYGGLTAEQLESICHQELPWQNARGNLKPYEPSTEVISDEDIFNCYAERLAESEWSTTTLEKTTIELELEVVAMTLEELHALIKSFRDKYEGECNLVIKVKM